MTAKGWRVFLRRLFADTQPSEGLADEIVEDITPERGVVMPGPSIDDDRPPAAGLGGFKVFDVEEHTAKTQRSLAFLLVIVLSVVNVVAVGAVVLNGISVDELVRIMGALSGFQTLAAAAIGFYFGKSRT